MGHEQEELKLIITVAYLSWFHVRIMFYLTTCSFIMGFPGGSAVKNPPAMKETWVRSLGWEYTLERGTAIYFSILAWRIPWTVYSPRGRKELDTTGVQSVKNLPAMQETACSAGDPVLILGLGRSPAEGIPTPVFLPGKFRGQRSLVDYSPWGCKIQTQLSN